MAKATKVKFYAVAVGKKPGIYTSWDECNKQVTGHKGSLHKSFNSRAAAEEFLQSQDGQVTTQAAESTTAPTAETNATTSAAPVTVQTVQSSSVSTVDPEKLYRVEFDGGSRGNPGTAGSGAVLICDASGQEIGRMCKSIGINTNNQAEYMGLLLGLEAALALGVTRLRAVGDSKLVVMQVKGEWQVKHPGLKPLQQKAIALKRQFQEFSIKHVLREHNKLADELSNIAMDQRAWAGVKTPEGEYIAVLPDDSAQTEAGINAAAAAVGDAHSDGPNAKRQRMFTEFALASTKVHSDAPIGR